MVEHSESKLVKYPPKKLTAILIVLIGIILASSRIQNIVIRNVVFRELSIHMQTQNSEDRLQLLLNALLADRFDLTQTANARARGILLLLLERPVEAMESFDKVEQSVLNQDIMGLYWLGLAAEAAGEYPTALVNMHQAGNHEYFPLLTGLSENEVIQLAEQMEHQPISYRAHLEFAKAVYSQNLSLAHSHFESAFQLAPDKLAAVTEPAWFYLDRGDLKHAEVFGKRALTLFPDEAWVKLFWARLYLAQGDEDEALAAFEQLLKQASPFSATANVIHYERGRIYYRQGKYASALREFLSSDNIQPDQWGVHLQLAQTYAQMGNCDRSAEFLESARRLLPNQELQERHFNPVVITVNDLCPKQ